MESIVCLNPYYTGIHLHYTSYFSSYGSAVS